MKLSTKIKCILRHPGISNLPKYFAVAGLFWSSIAPIQINALGEQASQAEKPAVLALSDVLPFSVAQEPDKAFCDFGLVLGSAFIGSTNPGLNLEDACQGKNQVESETKTTKVKVTVTAYSSTPDQTDSTPFTTAMGSQVRDGVVACNFLAFGTKVKLPEIYGDKIFVVEDRMAKRNSHKVDIWMESRADALQFGVKQLTLEIVE